METKTEPSDQKSKLSRCRYWIAEQSGRVMPSKEKAPEHEAKRSGVVTTRDLIEWSFQIACGMNYLTKRKVKFSKPIQRQFKELFTLRCFTVIWRQEMFYWPTVIS